MSEVLDDLKYTESHEWLQREADGTVTVGITDQAQTLLGDLVFVELPEVGEHKEAQEDCAVVESVKAASDVYSPIAGEVITVNESLADSPGTVNHSPYGDGWLFKLAPVDAADIDGLLDSDAYRQHIAEQE